MVDLSSRKGVVLTSTAFRAVTVFCPQCGTRIAELSFDTPRQIDSFEVECHECQTSLNAECMYGVVGHGQPEHRDTDEMKDVLTTYWERRLPTGIVPSRSDGRYVTRPKNEDTYDCFKEKYPINMDDTDYIEPTVEMLERFTSYANRFGWDWNPDVEL